MWVKLFIDRHKFDFGRNFNETRAAPVSNCLRYTILRHRAKLIAAVEEFVRAFSIVVTHRMVAKDFVFHGVPMRKGEEINLPLCLANRDPKMFPNPHVVDIGRKPRHLAFGTGAHLCLGIHLARREIRIVVEEFLKRFRNIGIRKGETYRYHGGRTFGVDYLPLEWDAA